MATLQILTIVILFIIVLVSVVIGSRAHQKEKEIKERRFKYLQLQNRADRMEQHIIGLSDVHTDTIVSDVFYDFYLENLRELLSYTDDPEKVELRIAKAEEERERELAELDVEPAELSFHEKTKYKERLTKAAKMLLYLRRKGRISNTHYKLCYTYLRWLNLWIQLNRQLVQANKNFHAGDMRVAQTLYGVIHSHLKSNNIDRPEKKTLEKYVDSRMQEILAPQLMAIQDAENPEEALADLMLNLEELPDVEGLDDPNGVPKEPL
ncbi:DNA topoisomerase I [Marinomonas piezotolerans]|uniref:DNA topoisomerase I n=1 Tax=Marinomonas piezotolerans TaxID=2213058 RepID=A0A370UE10_9GAMM|nr:DNA topoisomerase I [Marinomonas piezotolerans]RDL46023.1 DNA topoisomerase I [Marinomonas piezotolerans]